MSDLAAVRVTVGQMEGPTLGADILQDYCDRWLT